MAVLKNIVSKIFNLNTTPAKKTEGQFWYDTTNNVLKRSDGADYKPLAIDKNTVGNTSLSTILDSKANTSDLSKYLKKTGDIHLELGYKNTDYDSQTDTPSIIVGGGYAYDDFNFVEWWNRSTEITDLGINIIGEYSSSTAIDIINLNRSTGITIIGDWTSAQTLINHNSIMIGTANHIGNGIFEVTNPVFKVHSKDGIIGAFIDANLATELEDGHIATSKAIKSYVDTSVSNKANISDLSNYLPTSGGTISSNVHSALTIDVFGQSGGNVDGGLTVNNSYADLSSPDGDMHTNTTHYGATSITGDAVTSSIISGSNKLLTSGGAYTALQNKADKSELANKQDKLSFYSEDASSYTPSLEIGNGSTYTKIMTTNSIGDVIGDVQSIALISETGEIKINTANRLVLNANSISGSAIAHTIGTSTTSSKLPTEGAIVKAISDVKTSLGSALTYEGSVENYSNLPTGLNASDKGKVYNVVNANGNIPAGTNYAWNGTSWDALGGDMSAYLRKEGDTSLSLGILGTQQGSIKIFSDYEWAGSPTTLNYSGLSICVPDEGWAYYTGSGISFENNNSNLSITTYTGFSGDFVDTAIPAKPVNGHIATTGAIKTYVDNSTSNKVEKNSDAELNAFIMPTYNSSGVQNGKAKIKLYKDDTTGAITIEAEEVE